MNKFIFTILLFLGTVLSAQQNEYPKFAKQDYDTTYYKVSLHTYAHGELVIKIINILNKKYIKCSENAWLEVYKNKKKVFGEYFDKSDLDALGDYGGLYVPQPQTAQPWFAVVKLGSYDGIIYLINKNGTVRKLLGGSHFITKDAKYLFSVYRSDLAGVAVFDLQEANQMFSSTWDKPRINQWYSRDGEYFFTEAMYNDTTREWHENIKEIHVFSFVKKKFIVRKITRETIKRAHKITYNFDPKRDIK